MDKETYENFPENYRIIFNYLDGNKAEIQEIDALRKESADIEEVRRLVFDVSEPKYSFNIASNFNSFHGYRITPIYKKK